MPCPCSLQAAARNRRLPDCTVDTDHPTINGDTIMKKFIVVGAALLGSSSAAYAAAPDTVASFAMSCCDLVLACCDVAMSCCP